MKMKNLSSLRAAIRQAHLLDERTAIDSLISQAKISKNWRTKITHDAAALIEHIRSDDRPGLMEVFLAEYGLSSSEGIALMCLAEALLRVPDATTIDDLIEDKIAPSSWGKHLGKSASSLVNASTWGLMLTGKVLDDDATSGIANVLHSAIKRLGEPLIRTAVKRAMKEMGNQFVLGETIQNAVKRGMSHQTKGYTYSYDMLGEAALTKADAESFFHAYAASIESLATHARSSDIRENLGISIKLSALHPRYEFGQKARVMTELVERALSLALRAKAANMGLNIDAEEADRLDLSLDVIEAVLSDERLIGWDGFGIVVQAYGKRASSVIGWLHALATKLDRKIMVRLVKGAYWDTEIKRAQVEGLSHFPVFTRKSATDVSYVCCAQKLLSMSDRIYPQFATHNAHSVCAILKMGANTESYEFQRLHGMGEALHRQVMEQNNTRCRIYAPVGAHRDLLAYLVRRLLENGANSSFINQIIDETVSAAEIAQDPFEKLVREQTSPVAHIKMPSDLYGPARQNSYGWDLHNQTDVEKIDRSRDKFRDTYWEATPLMAAPFIGNDAGTSTNPANENDQVGTLTYATTDDVDTALAAAKPWLQASAKERETILNKAADNYEKHFGELFAVLTREAGKNPADAIAEVREAVDFLRFYATQIEAVGDRSARGIFACISPWNFPLAIFTGQIAAALAAGNGVIAKPADSTPIVATIAVKLLHKAGVPKSTLQLLPGRGSVVGAKLAADPRIQGMCFTGSTNTAQTINRTMADKIEPGAPFIAETGGINAMIVDSTALPEQAIRDIVASSFQSAGQRCSALRLLYLQQDIAEPFMEMLFGAMDELAIGNPWEFSTDVGPVISDSARTEILEHIETAKRENRLLKQLDAPSQGRFVGPAVIKVGGINDLAKEVFGPVLHIATFEANEIGQIIDDINASGYGLTFGLHTRIDDRVEQITSQLNVGNIYINRNQIGAIVGSQPFGGEGLSGTGPKAGGPHYVRSFTRGRTAAPTPVQVGKAISAQQAQAALDKVDRPKRAKLKTIDMPGPTGESNRLSLYPRGKILCLGPTPEIARRQAQLASDNGCTSLIICPGVNGDNALCGFLERTALTQLTSFDAVAIWSNASDLRAVRVALTQRNGQLITLITSEDAPERYVLERHICIDTTAAGGNAALLAASGAIAGHTNNAEPI